jgi:AraC-like DNA-binding protein
MPTDDRARHVADALLADPGTDRSLAALAADAGASRRTVERCFVAETGMPLARWRTQARLLEALRRLGAGATTVQVADAVGYSSPSAFVAAFRRELGTTPRRWVTPR